jgi:hypothetical protein
MMILFLLVAAALTSVLTGKTGKRADEKTGRWRTGGLIALLIAASSAR